MCWKTLVCLFRGSRWLFNTWKCSLTLCPGIGDWQSLNWDPAVTSNEAYRYCDNITSDKVLYPSTEKKRASVTHLLNEGGYKANRTLENSMLNMIGTTLTIDETTATC